jgi:hypothetical protein
LTGVIQIYREHEEVLEWEHVYRVFDKTNQLLDGLSALIDSLDDVLDSKVHMARPILESIKFGSPGEIQTKVDFGIADILRVIVEKIQYWSLDKQRYKEENQRRELENANLRIEIARNALHLRKEVEEAGMADDLILALSEPIKSVFDVRKLPSGLFGEGKLERGILTEQIIPVVAEIVGGDDPDLKIRVFKIAKGRESTVPSRRKRRQTRHD